MSMPLIPITTHKIAHILAECLFYLPKGIILPILSKIDETKDLLKHKQVACAYCDHHLKITPKKRSKIAFNFEIVLQNLQRSSAKLIENILNLIVSLMNKILPRALITFYSSCTQRFANLFSSRAIQCATFLQKHRNKVAWYCFIPLLILTGCVLYFGISLIPEIYIFLAASFWGGKILSHASNLIVSQQKSAEWAFLKQMWGRLRGEQSAFSQPIQQEAINLAKRAVIDIVLLNIINRIPQFIGYCFQAFFGWMLFYILVKTASEEAPVVLNRIERHLLANKNNLSEYSFENAFWLTSYQAFTLTASAHTYKRYEQLHQELHHEQRNRAHLGATSR